MEENTSVAWKIPARQDVPVGELAAFFVTLRQAGQKTEVFLKPNYSQLGDPKTLDGVEAAVDHIRQVRDRQGKIAIYGDYDIDGLTATALLADVFDRLGIAYMTYIPDRFIEGYGLHAAALVDLKKQGVDTVVTVDCGITAVEAVAEAAQVGLHVIVTDHHTLGPAEPAAAVALLNPLRPTSQYPERLLSGVGVAFTLARALQVAFPEELPAGQEKWLLDLVALGTVCDVVPLVGENRILAYYGLQVARRSRRAGLRVLAEISGCTVAGLTARDFGFKIGPRLNAAGRLEHARTALELLMTQDTQQATQLARQLNELNMARRAITERMTTEALAQAAEYHEDPILVLSSSDWSHGVAGLVASRVAEAEGKPTIILQVEGKTAKGSARSFGRFSLIAALRDSTELFERFGGHDAAAGITLSVGNIAKLRQALIAFCDSDEQRATLVREISADAWLLGEYVSQAGLDQLALLEPTGQANPEIRFYFRGELGDVRWVGADQDHAQMQFTVDGQPLRCIAFQAKRQWAWLEPGLEVEAILVLQGSEWNGMKRVEGQILHVRKAQA